jgi:RNA polymerase sigma-70 factor, ECF subfamily
MNDEQVLIVRAREGDMRAFRGLVEIHKRFVFRLAWDLTGNFHDAEDLSQEVFVRMFRSLDRFRGDCKLSTWLYTITSHTWIELYGTGRSKFNRSLLPLEDDRTEDFPLAAESSGTSPEDSAETSLFHKHVQNALSSLSPRERGVFVLRFFHDLKLSDIADHLKITPGAVKSHLYRSVRKMQKELSFLVEERL